MTVIGDDHHYKNDDTQRQKKGKYACFQIYSNIKKLLLLFFGFI